MKKIIQVFLVILAMSQLISSYIFSNNTNLTQGSFSGLPLSPKPYAFMIWGVIIILSIISTIYLVYKNKLNLKIMILSSTVFIAYTLWLVAAIMDYLFISIIIFIIMNIALLLLNKDKIIIQNSLSNISYKIYFGWASIAIFLNILALIDKFSPDNIYFSIGILVCIIVTIIKINLVFNYNIFYNLTILWALIAILLNLTNTMGILFYLVLGATVVIVILLVYGVKKIKTVSIKK